MIVTTNRLSGDFGDLSFRQRGQTSGRGLSRDEAITVFEKFFDTVRGSRSLFSGTIFDDPLKRIPLVMPIAPQLGEMGPPCVYLTNENCEQPWGYYHWMFTPASADDEPMQYASSEELVTFFDANSLDYSKGALSLFASYQFVAAQCRDDLRDRLERAQGAITRFEKLGRRVDALETYIATVLRDQVTRA